MTKKLSKKKNVETKKVGEKGNRNLCLETELFYKKKYLYKKYAGFYTDFLL